MQTSSPLSIWSIYCQTEFAGLIHGFARVRKFLTGLQIFLGLNGAYLFHCACFHLRLAMTFELFFQLAISKRDFHFS